jgi:hypothetical protein
MPKGDRILGLETFDCSVFDVVLVLDQFSGTVLLFFSSLLCSVVLFHDVLIY